MARLLSSLGRFSFRRRRIVTLIWMVVVASFVLGAGTLSGSTSDDFALPGTEAQEAGDLVAERFGGTQVNAASAQVVFQAPDGESITSPENAAAVAEAVTALDKIDSAVVATDPLDPATPLVSPDGSTAISTVQFEADPGAVPQSDQDELVSVVEDARSAGLVVEVGGTALLSEPEPPASEALGVGIALVVLLLTFGSVVAAGLSLTTALIGVGVGVLGITIATGFFELSSSVMTLALMLGLAVGIDYALLVVSRYRHEIATGRDGESAMARAAGTAGSAVFFAGLTVIIALTGLAIVGIPFLTTMGIAAAGTVATAVVVALTLLPALLGFAGERVMGRKWRKAASAQDVMDPEGDSNPAARRVASGIVRYRVPVAAAVIVGLSALTIPALSLNTSLPTDATAPAESSERKANDIVAESFGPGFNSQLIAVVDMVEVDDPQAVAQDAVQTLSGVDGVAFVAPPQLNQAGDTALISIVPTTGPSDPATEDLVGDIRAAADPFYETTGATVFVTGVTAVNIDTSDKLSEALPVYLLVVVGLAMLLLMLVFRSVLVPLTAAGGFLLSIGAALGATVAVFQWGHLEWLFGHEPAPIISFMPIFLTGVLFGLAMDYQVFLVSRMREDYVHGDTARTAIINGYIHGSRVVTAAALIMISVFAGFMFAEDAIIQSMGFALAFGVFVDAFVVRMLLIPAILAMLGDSAWWVPRWLDRVMPNVDIEGESLRDPEPIDADLTPATAGVR